MIDVPRIREDFPELSSGVIFLDNAASTLKPIQVLNAMREFGIKKYANVHRGVYKLSMEASIAYDTAREVVASFINADPGEVVFTYNSTDGLRRIALILLGNKVIGPGDEILVTQAEHHSNLLPWQGISRVTGARLRVLPVDGSGVPRWDLLDEYLTERTKLVSIAHVSNVTGSIAPVKEVSRKAKERGALVVVDSAQGAPHLKIDVKDMDADFLVFSGHKMLGPTGIGVLWIRSDLAEELEPVMGGGGTVLDVSIEDNSIHVVWDEPPLRWEPGTPPIIEAVGLAEAVKYLERIGMEAITEHEFGLTKTLFEVITDCLGERIRILGPMDPGRRLGILSFTLEGLNVEAVGLHLAARNIAVRTGRHCAHPLHYALNAPQGSVRASLYLYNDENDIHVFVDALKELIGKG